MAEWILYNCAEVIIRFVASEALRRIGKVLGGKQNLLVPQEIGSLKIWLAKFGFSHLLEELLHYVEMEADDLRRPPHQKIGFEILIKLIKEVIDTKKQHPQSFKMNIEKNLNTKKTASQEKRNNTHQTTSPPTIDPSDPLFIHTSDHSSMILVPEVLNGTNYAIWRPFMWKSLGEKNKLGFIKGTIPRPSKSDPKNALWQQCNDMVLSWIRNTLNEKIANSVLYAETPSEIWLHLQERFLQDDFFQHYQIQRSIVELKQNQGSISLYYTRIKSLWDELEMCSLTVSCTCGGLKQLSNREERVRLGQFLMGLNEIYSIVGKQIMCMHPLPTVTKAYSLLCEEEKQRGLVEQKIPDQSHASNIKLEQIPDKSHAINVKLEEILDQSHAMNVKSEKILDHSHAMNVKHEEIFNQSHAMNVKSEEIFDQSHAMNVKSEEIPDQSHAMNVKSKKISDQSHPINVKSEEIPDQSHVMNVKSEGIPNQSHAMNVRSEKISDQSYAMNAKSDSPSSRQDSSQTWTSGSSNTQKSKKQLHCTYCSGSTHTVKWCFYLNGFPIGHYLHGKDVQPPNRGARKVFVNHTRTESTQAIHTSNQSLQFAREGFSQTKDFLSKENPPISAKFIGLRKGRWSREAR